MEAQKGSIGLRILRNSLATYAIGLLVGGLVGTASIGMPLGKQEGRRDLEAAVKTAKVMDVNHDGKADLYLGNKLYIATDTSFISLEQHQKAKSQAEIDAAYKNIK